MDEPVKNQLNISANQTHVQVCLIDEDDVAHVLFTCPVEQALQFFTEGRAAVLSMRPDLDVTGVPPNWF
jgi:hypothetical protein